MKNQRHITKRRRLEAREAEQAMRSIEGVDGMTLRRMARQGHAGARAELERLYAKAWAASTKGSMSW